MALDATGLSVFQHGAYVMSNAVLCLWALQITSAL